MIEDSSVATGNEAAHQMSQSLYALVQNLTVLYGEGGASYLAKRLMAIALGELMSRPQNNTQHKPLSASDRMLICYGDMYATNQAHQRLEALCCTTSQTEHIGDSYSAVFPSSSDDGFVVDYQAVRRDLGDWSDISALSADRIMFDLVINHCSERTWFADFIGGKEPAATTFTKCRQWSASKMWSGRAILRC